MNDTGISRLWTLSFGSSAWGRRFFVTTKGRIGLGPRGMQSVDKICIFLGGGIQFVVRENGNYWVLVGEVYVNGLMDGEAMEGQMEVRKFTLC